METPTIIIWGEDGPAMITEQIASKYSLTRGQRITDSILFSQIIEDNMAQTACSIEAQKSGEECVACSA